MQDTGPSGPSLMTPDLDPLQFAYRKGRGMDDAINNLMHLVLNHLEDSDAYARLLCIDFSSDFNTIQPHVLMKTILINL